LPGLLAHPSFARELGAAQLPWRLVVSHAARDGVPVPAMAAALAHYDTLRAPRLPAALTQAQRDFFGAHTYRRNDRPGTYHTRWDLDRSEELRG
ncbi:NADP-dependent phosphogluconate dehydrogenase, partial [Streptomyces nigra]